MMKENLIRVSIWQHPMVEGPFAQMRGGIKISRELENFVYSVKDSKKPIFI